VIAGGFTPRRHDSAAIRVPEPASDEGPLGISQESLEIGTVWSAPDFRHELTVRNLTTADVVVKRVVASCECTSISPASFRLSPGAQRQLALGIDLTRASGAIEERTERSLAAELKFVMAGGRVQVFQLGGKVAFPFVANGVPITFERPVPFDAAPPTATFAIHKHRDVTELSVLIDPAEGTVRRVPALSSARVDVFEVEPSPRRPLGDFWFEIRVDAHVKGRGTAGEMPVQVFGAVEADVGWSPSNVLLVVDGSRIAPSETVVFWSRSGTPFEVLDAESIPSFVTATTEPSTLGNESALSPVIHLRAEESVAARREGKVLVRLRSSAHDRVLHAAIPVTVQPVEVAARVTPEPARAEDE
jgi:hypothetical protein